MTACCRAFRSKRWMCSLPAPIHALAFLRCFTLQLAHQPLRCWQTFLERGATVKGGFPGRRFHLCPIVQYGVQVHHSGLIQQGQKFGEQFSSASWWPTRKSANV